MFTYVSVSLLFLSRTLVPQGYVRIFVTSRFSYYHSVRVDQMSPYSRFYQEAIILSFLSLLGVL